MLDLFAIIGGAADAPTRTTRRKHARQSCLRQVIMSVEGDEPVDHLFFEDSELTLICRTDLLSSTAGADSATHNSAAQLARLYRGQGDKFVSELRGCFAI